MSLEKDIANVNESFWLNEATPREHFRGAGKKEIATRQEGILKGKVKNAFDIVIDDLHGTVNELHYGWDEGELMTKEDLRILAITLRSSITTFKNAGITI